MTEGASGIAAPLRAMVLAAGMGLRMRPLTLTLPKPLLTVAGRTLLDHCLDRLVEAGVEQAVVNSHYLGEMISAHLAGRSRPALQLSPEPVLLETGGGIKRALHHFGCDPFIVANSDNLWLDGAAPAVARLVAGWQPARMDALLLLVPVERARGYDGPGDFHRNPDGSLTRRAAEGRAPLVFAGVHLTKPALFRDTPDGPFSTNLVWDRIAPAGRLHGLIHDGEWFHVGTPEALAATNAWFAAERPPAR